MSNDAQSSSATEQNIDTPDYECRDCSDRYFTKLGASGHAVAADHSVENIRTGEILERTQDTETEQPGGRDD